MTTLASKRSSRPESGGHAVVRMTASAATDAGRVRTRNEDSVLVAEALVAVADGLGGHPGGDVASAVALEALTSLGARRDTTPAQLAEAIGAANRAVLERGEADPTLAGLGTTLCGVALGVAEGASCCLVFNVGDSRVYLYGDARLVQISVDHSEAQELQDAGVLSAEAAATYVRRNVITRCLGAEPGPLPDIWSVPAVTGQRYLVCSDGLTNELDDAAIADVLGSFAEPAAAVAQLVARTLDAGGRDNVTVVIADIDVADLG